jgi:hypothetical protein
MQIKFLASKISRVIKAAWLVWSVPQALLSGYHLRYEIRHYWDARIIWPTSLYLVFRPTRLILAILAYLGFGFLKQTITDFFDALEEESLNIYG